MKETIVFHISWKYWCFLHLYGSFPGESFLINMSVLLYIYRYANFLVNNGRVMRQETLNIMEKTQNNSTLIKYFSLTYKLSWCGISVLQKSLQVQAPSLLFFHHF